MKMHKIALVAVGHEDYDTALQQELLSGAQTQIEGLGFEVRKSPDIVTDHRIAEKAAKEIAAADSSGVVIFLASWVECPVVMSVIREIEHLPFCVWGIPMFERDGQLDSTGSYVSFAMFKGTLDRVGYAYSHVLGAAGEEKVGRSLRAFCRAAICRSALKRSRIGLVGYTSMGIYPGTFDHVMMRVRIGPEVVQSDSYTLIHLAEQASEPEKDQVLALWKRYSRISEDISADNLRKTAGLYLALRRLVETQDLHAVNVKCQYEFSKEYKAVPCSALSLLAETTAVASCEGDIPNTVSMLMLHYLTGQAVTYGDVINHTGNAVKLSACGFLPFSLGRPGEQLIQNFMPHPGFTGVQNSFCMRPERVTALRLVEDRCGYHLLYFTGQGLDTELRQGYMPALDVLLDGSVDDLVRHYAGQHFAICYGDVSEELEALACLMNIKTIRV